MVPTLVKEILEHEGVIAIVTQSKEAKPHLVNTWNSYIVVGEDDTFMIPAGRMQITEKNLKKNKEVLLSLGSKEVQGRFSKGAGFLIEGEGEFVFTGSEFEQMKERFTWIRAALLIRCTSFTQTL
jgi:flavin reductase (DIM6/NTAB) family NADH-FMN oxidoreductase RutF